MEYDPASEEASGIEISEKQLEEGMVHHMPPHGDDSNIQVGLWLNPTISDENGTSNELWRDGLKTLPFASRFKKKISRLHLKKKLWRFLLALNHLVLKITDDISCS